MDGIQCGEFFVVHPMRYHNKPSDEKVAALFNDPNWGLQEKKDGSYFQLMKNDSGSVGLFSRTVSKTSGEYVDRIENVPHIKQWALANMRPGTTFIGEIYIPGKKSNDITKIMGALPDKAVSRQFDSDSFGGPVHFYAFDCIRVDGEYIADKSFSYRMSIAYDSLSNAEESEFIEAAKTYYCDTSDFNEILSEIFAKGGEGVVVKNLLHEYEPNKRPTNAAFKLKEHVDSIDFVITGLLDPEIEYSGKELHSWPYWAVKTNSGNGFEQMLFNGGKQEVDAFNAQHPEYDMIPVTKPFFLEWKNAMTIGAYDDDGNLVDIGRVASGIDDFMRADMANNPDDYIGKVVEVSCMSINKKDRSLRHPALIRMREDKNPKECLISEIFE